MAKNRAKYDFNASVQINDRGADGSLQRLFYLIARARTAGDWRQINNMAHGLLDTYMEEEKGQETGYSVLLNALCCCTHTVRNLQTAIQHCAAALGAGGQ